MRQHKARPAGPTPDDATTGCAVCSATIKRVPGGHGPVWVHAHDGHVVGWGEDLAPLMRRTHALISAVLRDAAPHLARVDFAELNEILLELDRRSQ